MTFDQGTDPTSGDSFDSFDPLIAQRFEVLNSVRVPGHGEQLQPLHAVAPPATTGYRPFIGLAAAAALFVVVGVSFLATRPDTDQDVTVSNGPVAEVEGDILQDQDGGAKELTVSVPESSTTTTTGQVAESSTPTEASVEEEAAPSDADQSETTDPPGPDTTVQQDDTTSTEVPKTEPTTPATNPPKESLPPVSASVPVPTTDYPDLEERIITLRGIVEEVFTDCEAKLYLDENGEVKQGGPVSCDGGSYMVIDGRRVQTSAGFVSADQYYDRHNSRIRPGQSVVVFAVSSRWAEDILTLDCRQCGISLGG